MDCMKKRKISRTTQLKICKKWIITFVAVIIVFTSLIIIWSVRNYMNDNEIIALINGEPVTVREFKIQFLNKNIAAVSQYFYNKYGAEDKSDFWTSNYGGEIPVEVLKKRSLDQCIKTKVQQILGRQKGLVKDISYTAYLQGFIEENKRRKETVENDKVIYGPQQLQEDVYYYVLFNDMVYKLKQGISKDLKIDEEELKQNYVENKSKLYMLPDYIKIKKISVAYIDKDSSDNKVTREQAQAKIEEIKAKLDKGGNFDNIGSQYSKYSGFKIGYGEQMFNENTIRSDVFSGSSLKGEAQKLAPGQISGVFEDKGEKSFYIIICVQKITFRYIPFNEAKGSIESNLAETKYTKIVDKLIKEAKVSIAESVYKRTNGIR